MEYLKNYYDEDLDLSRIYRYLDRLDDRHRELVQDISVRHTMLPVIREFVANVNRRGIALYFCKFNLDK